MLTNENRSNSSSWLIDFRTSFHFTDNQSIFIFFTSIISTVDNIDNSSTITKRENASIRLLNSFTVKLSDVLMMSDMKINLLFTQILKMQKMINQQKLHEYEFYKNDTIIAKNTHHEKIIIGNLAFRNWEQDWPTTRM